MADLFSNPEWFILAKFLLAMFLGALIGIERELSDKPAGVRTNMIVAGVSCLLISLNDLVKHEPGAGINPETHFLVDALITGVSFLGAGTIIQGGRSSRKVEGLTTAAALLLSALVGIYVAFWRLWVAVGVTLVTLFVLHSFWLTNLASDARQKKP